MRELETAEPDLKATITFSVSQPLEVPLVEALTPQEQLELVDSLRRANPRQSQGSPGLMSSMYGYDGEYDGKYQAYADEALPAYAASVHKLVQDYHAQVGLKLTIANDGAVQGENLVVELRATGGGMRERFLAHAVFGPPTPRVRNKTELLMRNMPRFNPGDFRTPVAGRHEVVFETEADGGDYVAIHCADFRQGWKWDWDGIAHVDPTSDEFTVELTVTASNMKGTRVETFALPVKSKSVRVADLVNPVERDYVVSFPLQERFDEALEGGEMDWLEFPERE